MAFLNRVGNLLRQSTSQNGRVPMTSMLGSMLYMSTSTKLYVGGLSYAINDQSLEEAFSGFGDVVEAKVITDRDSGRSKGFGFVNFSSNESASSALSAMDGQDLNGRNIKVSYATDKPARPQSFGGGNEGYNRRNDSY